jgi:formylglycine-generating enzyme required for sulfatase activity
VGNGWEWTSSPFAPFPGFKAYISSYPGYSVDFFDDRHTVMLGASWATPTGLIRRSFRNWYHGHYPYVFAKFRCVWND